MINWNIIRAAGVGAYVMLWASVVWGLVSSTLLFGRKATKTTTVALHQAFSTMGLLLLAAHLGFLLRDAFLPFSWLDVLVPMRATYRPIGVALGIGAMFVMVLGVLSTSWGRRLIGAKWWKRMHALSIPAFALALVHGLMTGTDTRRPAMWWMYVVTACVVLFLLLVRALTAGERRAALLAESREPEPEPPSPAPPRRRSPFAVRPAPVAIVRDLPSAAPPRYRIAAPPSEQIPEDDFDLDDEWLAEDETTGAAAPISTSAGRGANTDGTGHAAGRKKGRGHAPRRRPTNRSPGPGG